MSRACVLVFGLLACGDNLRPDQPDDARPVDGPLDAIARVNGGFVVAGDTFPGTVRPAT